MTPAFDRGAITDAALRRWRERELERALEVQFAEPDGVVPGERAAWDAIRAAAATRLVSGARWSTLGPDD